MKVIYQRRGFMIPKDVNPFLYQFELEDGRPVFEVEGDSAIPYKFLRIPSTKYYEYGGTHEEALKELAQVGAEITEGNEL